MYTDNHKPPRCAQLTDVEEAMEKWEEQLRDYKKRGASDMPEHEKAWIIVKMLPLLTPPTLFLDLAELC